ncbi:hypothetical protein CH333_07015 [candidate division WOR-3 bacterium JGI_Cruoil_03_44_89]|uniref:Bacterial Pleckstrin homology domain-containing protein n=1 Tax=candidate division WOR-3 bacterium JGI_Cruoil_03_44_89 TaxID=1973748 RepID=A0A235BRS8_UNCW3|nr:MAG: hypothetical protein CH333_07015 [candidate division WOR-3 bacterium JGI_Cruoil_03_44_89]
MVGEVFPIVPSSAASLWVIFGIVIFLLIFLALFGFIGYWARNTKFELTDGGLQIRGGIYRRFIPKSSLIREDAKILDLNADGEYRPKLRTNGIGLPGYNAGWFKLRNGDKALLFVTNPSKVIYIPSKEGYSVLLSTSRPEEFLTLIGELW